jgi:hypothetical protein
MKTLLVAGGACALALALSGCSTAGQQQVLTNLQGCERHYDGTISAGMTGGQFAGTVKIDCPHAAVTVAPIAATP